jgi:hypothetical protein
MKKILLFSLACLLLSACGVSKEQRAATLVAAALQTGEAALTATFTPSPTATPIPATLTPMPSLTPLPPTLTPTAPPLVIVSASGETIAYNGPGEDYAAVTTLSQSQVLDYVGRSEDGQWIVFAVSDYQNAWVAAENLLINFDAQTLDAIEAPPTQEITHKLLIVNNAKDDWFISISEAGIPATNLAEGESVVYELPSQTYHVVIGNKSGGETKIVVLTSDKTVTLSTTGTHRLLITVQ